MFFLTYRVDTFDQVIQINQNNGPINMNSHVN